jgi:hypothetical protein
VNLIFAREKVYVFVFGTVEQEESGSEAGMEKSLREQKRMRSKPTIAENLQYA